MERGQGDGDIGTHVWGLILGMRDEGLGNIKYGTRGCVGQGRVTLNAYRDVGTSNMGRRGTLMIIAKVRVKCDISFFMKMCYLLSTLDSIVQNHFGHLMMLTQNISSYRSKRLTIVIRVKHC